MYWWDCKNDEYLELESLTIEKFTNPGQTLSHYRMILKIEGVGKERETRSTRVLNLVEQINLFLCETKG